MDPSPSDAVPVSAKSFKLLFLVVAALLAGMAMWGADKRSLGLFHDDAIYVVVAKAMAQGDGYRIISLPGEPAQTKYPFLYSYLVSWLWSLNPEFPANIFLLKSLNIAALLGIYSLSIVLYRRVFGVARMGAVVFGVLVGINPLIFTFTDFVVSDLLFALLTLAMLVISRNKAEMGSELRLGALAGLACLVRLAAAPLVLAGIAFFLRDLKCRAAIRFAAIAGLLIAPWIYWSSAQPKGAYSLLSYYSAYDFVASAPTEIGARLVRQAEIVSANGRYLYESFNLLYLLPLLPVLLPVVGGLTLLGMAVSRDRADFFAWTFFIASSVLLLVWPFHPVRYLAPLVPLLLLFLFRGMAAAEHCLETRGGDYALKPLVAKLPWVTILPLLLLQGVWVSSYLLIRDPETTRGGFGRRMEYSWSGFEESFAWVRKNTPAGARLATAYDPMYFLYTGRQAIRPALHRPATYFYPYGRAKPDVGSVAEIKGGLDALGIDYLIIDPMQGYAEGRAAIQLMEEIVKAYGVHAQAVFTSTDGQHRIYALRRG